MRIGLVFVFLCVGIFIVIVFTSKKSSTLHFPLQKFQEQLLENPQKIKNRYITVYGFVKEGSIEKKGIQANFILQNKEGNITLPVFFTGKTLLPDTFKDGSEASVDGTYQFQQKMLVADKVLAKCASKYEGKAYPKK